MLKSRNIQILMLGIMFVIVAMFSGFGLNNVVYANSNIEVQKTILAPIALRDRFEVKPDAVLPDFTDKTEVDNVLGSPTPSFDDGILYDTLLNIYKDYCLSKGEVYNSSYLRINMFKDFTKLDLSNLIIGTSNEITLQGFNTLNLQNLEVLNLSNNNIAYFGIELLPGVQIKVDSETNEQRVVVSEYSPLNTIKTLNLSSNSLRTEFDATNFRDLVNLDVSNNEIPNVKVLKTQEADCVLNYSNNKIKDFEKLILPEHAKVTLILFGNPISEIKTIPTNIKLEIGILNLRDRIDSSTLLHYIKFKELKVEAKIYTKVMTKHGEEDIEIFEPYNYNPNNQEDFMFKLPTNNYKVEYINSNTNEVLSSKEFTVTPPVADFYYIIKGKRYENFEGKINGKASIHFESPSSDIKIFYAYGNGDWIEGNVCNLKKLKGHATIRFKTVENGIESETHQIMLHLSYSGFIPDAVIIVLVIAFIVFLALVVVPLFKKMLDKISK